MTSTCYLVLIPTLIVDHGVCSVCAECVNVPLDCFCESAGTWQWRCGHVDVCVDFAVEHTQSLCVCSHHC